MKKNQLNLLSIAIILLVVSLSFLIYYQYSLNIKKQQEEYIFENFINSLQNLQNTINSIQGTYYIKVDIPNGVLLYANGTELIIQYDNNNYTINFYKNVTLYNNNQNVSFLYPNNYIYLVSTNNSVFITTNLQNSITILNEYLPNGTLIYITPGNNQNSPNNNQNSQCLFTYNGQTNFFWGDVNGYNYLPPIGDQGECGDCWAFASSNGIASVYMIRNNEPNEGLQLSPAYLAIECNYEYPNTPYYCNNNFGCNGGDPYSAILFASQYGIPNDTGWNYYESTLGNHCPQQYYQNYETYPGDVCNFNYNGPVSPLYYPKDATELVSPSLGNGPLSDQQIIQDLLCYGPLVVSGWMGGTGGSNPNIYPEEYVTSGHAMLLVGYDEQSQLCQEMYGTPKCWIFENQWGKRSECIIIVQNGEIGAPYLCNTSKCPITTCSEYYFNYQLCNQKIQQKFPGWVCGGVYWMQNGYVYVPFDQSPYGLSFPQLEIVAIQNVTLQQ